MKVPFISFPNTSVFKGISKGRKGLGFKDGNLVVADSLGNETAIDYAAADVAALAAYDLLRAPFDGQPVVYDDADAAVPMTGV